MHIAIYNVAGRKVTNLASGFESGGVKTVEWSARSQDGRQLVRGVYFVRAAIGSDVKVSRVLLVE